MRRCSLRPFVELLEDRTVPANLALTDLRLVDGEGVLQEDMSGAYAVYGQMLHFRASWSATAMASGQNAVIRISANGYSLDSNPINFDAGNSSGNVTLKGWYVGKTAFPVSAVIDPGNSVAESNEGDNSKALTFAAVAPSTLGLTTKFVYPLGRTANSDFTIFNYHDADPRPDDFNSGNGYEGKDPRGGIYMYDGHEGDDVQGFGNDSMDAGFPVYALADGTVTFNQDGKYDRETWNYTSDGNYLFFDHGNGWGSAYFHLAKDSLTVKGGDTVKQGQVIALMGASGYSGGVAHLHYSPLYRGAVVDPLFAPEDYWQTPLPYSGDVAPFLWDMFISNTPIDYYDLYEHHPRVNKFSTTDPGTIYFAAQTWNIKTASHTTVMAWKWYKPDGTLWNTWGTTYQAAFETRNDYWTWSWNVSDFAFAPGTWQYAFEFDGVEQRRIPFTIAATGDADIRVHTTNPITGDTNAIVIDERTTPIDIGTVAQGGAAPTKSFTIANRGTSALTLGSFIAPPGFTIVSPPASVAANSTATLVVRLDSAVVGAKFGRLSFTTNDPDVPVMNFNVSGVVTGTPVVGAPVITLTDKALGYNFKSLPRRFAPTATMTDSDSANFNGGTLVVEFASGGNADDRLLFQDDGQGPGQIGSFSAMPAVTYSGVIIGLFSGGAGSIPLTVTFNSDATPTAVQALIRNLTYRNTGTTPSYHRRYIRLTLTDNAGKVSNLPIANVTPSGVERAPTIAPIAPSTTAIGVPFTRTGSFSDPYGNSWTGTVNYLDGTGPQPLVLNPDKTFTLTRAYGTPGVRNAFLTIVSDTGGTTTLPFTVTVVMPPTVSGFTVNGGDSQRSRITTITVTLGATANAAQFQEPGAITLTRTGTGTVVQTGAVGPNGRILVTPASGTTSILTLTFDNADGAPVSDGVESGSLADGYWRLAVPSAGFQSTLNDPTLRRLFGDFDANGTVDGAVDFPAFGAAFNQTAVSSPFDFNGDGLVDGAVDFPAFGSRFNLSL